MQHFTQWWLCIEVVGTVAFALSGLVEAFRKRLDPVGVCVVVFLASFGGGTVRDLLLDQRPFFWVRHSGYVWGVMGLSLAGMLFLRIRHIEPTERAIQFPDALGLGLFTASAVLQTKASGLPPIICVLMGVITGVFGGVLRDIVCNEIPTAFKDHRPYALLSFCGGWLCLALCRTSLDPTWVALTTVFITAGLRVLSIQRDWRLPTWRAK